MGNALQRGTNAPPRVKPLQTFSRQTQPPEWPPAVPCCSVAQYPSMKPLQTVHYLLRGLLLFLVAEYPHIEAFADRTLPPEGPLTVPCCGIAPVPMRETRPMCRQTLPPQWPPAVPCCEIAQYPHMKPLQTIHHLLRGLLVTQNLC